MFYIIREESFAVILHMGESSLILTPEEREYLEIQTRTCTIQTTPLTVLISYY